MLIQTVIVDGEPLARTRLRSMLESDPEIHIAAECSSGAKALMTIQRLQPALIFMNVEMSGHNELDVVSSLPWRPVTIAVTAHRDYASSALETGAFDSLPKALPQARFSRVLRRAKKHIAQSNHALAEENRGHHAVAGATADLLVVKTAGKLVFVRMTELRWVEAEKDYMRLHLRSGSCFIRETMTNLQNRLDPRTFLRIHRSTIVNINEIREVAPLAGNDCSVTLRDGTELTMSRRYRASLDRLLDCKPEEIEPDLQQGPSFGGGELGTQTA